MCMTVIVSQSHMKYDHCRPHTTICHNIYFWKIIILCWQNVRQSLECLTKKVSNKVTRSITHCNSTILSVWKITDILLCQITACNHCNAQKHDTIEYRTPSSKHSSQTTTVRICESFPFTWQHAGIEPCIQPKPGHTYPIDTNQTYTGQFWSEHVLHM